MIATNAPEFIWSNTDFPYMCLKDSDRTSAFREAILNVVRKDDIVLDVGSGTGIFSLFAAEAGAKMVHAVEIDHFLAETLRKTVKESGFRSIISVVEADVMQAKLPKVDVVIAEIIDTGLMDEMQVPALNSLRRRKIIDEHTRIIPSKYQTYIDLVLADNTYFGYEIYAPKHEWPFYKSGHKEGWETTKVEQISVKKMVGEYCFEEGLVDEVLDKEVSVSIPKGKVANAVRISGKIHLTQNHIIGATNAVNGDKIISIDTLTEGDYIFRFKNKLATGLGGLKIEYLRV